MRQRYSFPLFVTALWISGCLSATRAADVQVKVDNIFFSPRYVTINVNDQIVWTWVAGGHTTTHSGNPRLWNSGYRTSGTFSRVFDTVGTYPYLCTVIDHIGMNGSVTVQGSNTPPTVSITSPVNNTVLVEPATFTITADASDPDGSVSQVEFFRDTTSLGLVTTSPYIANISNLDAGTYTISAVATDNRNTTSTSSVATVSVVTPVAITLSAAQALSATRFQFSYTANPGLRYVVLGSPVLTNWTVLATKTATSDAELFTDQITTNRNFYRVGRLPNP